MKIKANYVNEAQWKILTVRATLPEELKCLDELAHNMWWVWNHEARDLFRDLDVDLYHKTRGPQGPRTVCDFPSLLLLALALASVSMATVRPAMGCPSSAPHYCMPTTRSPPLTTW